MAQVLQAISSGGKQYYTTVLSNFQYIGKSGGSLSNFLNGNYGLIGFECDESTASNIKTKMIFDAYIPDNFEIKNAYITLTHYPLKIYNSSNVAVGWGYSRNIKVYKAVNVTDIYRKYLANSEFKDEETETYIDMNVFDINQYTPSVPSDSNHILESAKSWNIQLSKGFNRLKIESADTIPTFTTPFDEANYLNLASKSGMISATLNVIGDAK